MSLVIFQLAINYTETFNCKSEMCLQLLTLHCQQIILLNRCLCTATFKISEILLSVIEQADTYSNLSKIE